MTLTLNSFLEVTVLLDSGSIQEVAAESEWQKGASFYKTA